MNSTLILLVTVVGYIAAINLLTHFASRKADNATFFSGNRKMSWLMVAAAMVCAPITGVTFVSVPAMVLSHGHSYLQMALGFVVGYALIAWVLIPLFYRRNVVSIYSVLHDYFGPTGHKAGAWMFLVSKILGAAVRLFVVCLSLQLIVFDRIGIPFAANVALIVALTWAYTARGGVRSVVWADMFKSLCLIVSLTLCILLVCSAMGLTLTDIPHKVHSHATSRMFFFDNPSESTYFWKQFVGGIFLVIAMTGLDQDMMQHPLSCRNIGGARRNMALSGLLQLAIIAMFLILGSLLAMYLEQNSMTAPDKSDALFAAVAFHDRMPAALEVLFVLGLVASSYSSLGSSLTSLTTTFSVDILGIHRLADNGVSKNRRLIVHTAMAIALALVILSLYYAESDNAINAVYTLASYTYGPILGLFAFIVISRQRLSSRWIPAVCVAAPCLTWIAQWWLLDTLQYQIGYGLLLLNALFTVTGLSLLWLACRRKQLPSQNAST